MTHSRPLEERLYDRLAVDFETGCWNYTGTLYQSGYGKIGAGGRDIVMPAHRAMWQVKHGSIPEGKWILHHCDNRRCCRPEHLFLGDSDANVADMVAKRRHRPRGRTPVNIGERQRRLGASERWQSMTLEQQHEQRSKAAASWQRKRDVT